MQHHLSATPFGRRPLTLAHVAAQAAARGRPPEKAVHKWNLFRAICAARTRLGVPERALAVLDALLSFHPETVLTGEGLTVFPSNEQLSLRAHGMAPSTLRRHLAALVDAGLLIRRDSPNGKRYARKGRDGEIETAFGFDLSALVARAEEIEGLAEAVRAEERALKLVRERITICRRDIAKAIAAGLEEGVEADWTGIHALYRSIVDGIPRTAARAVLEPIADDLSLLADEVLNLLEAKTEAVNPSGNESQIERHIQNSNPNFSIELEPVSRGEQGSEIELPVQTKRPPSTGFPLGMVLDACPDILDYARGGLANWRDFRAAVEVVRPMLGVSPSAWEAAQAAMGEIPAAIVVAAILQKGAAVQSAGGYLRELTRRAEAGEFSPGPMLMALIGERRRDRKKSA